MVKSPLDVLMGLQVIRTRKVHGLNGLVDLARSLLTGNAELRRRALAEIIVADQGLTGSLTLELARSLYRTGISSLSELSGYRSFLAAAAGNPSYSSQPVWVTLPEHCVGDLEGAVEALQAAAPRGLNIQGVCLEPDPPLSPIELFARLGFGYRKPSGVKALIKKEIQGLSGNHRLMAELELVYDCAVREAEQSDPGYAAFLREECWLHP